jgi:hypothetical protein
MKRAEINEYIQTGAAIVAIVGIFLLGYEVKQSNSLATQQASSQSWTNWIDYYSSTIEAGMSETIMKSHNDPENLTPAEKYDLHLQISGFLFLFASDLDVFSFTDSGVVDEEVEAAIEFLSDSLAYPYGRAWAHEHIREYLPPSVAQRVLTRLDVLPEYWSLEYFDRASVRLAAMKADDTRTN